MDAADTRPRLLVHSRNSHPVVFEIAEDGIRRLVKRDSRASDKAVSLCVSTLSCGRLGQICSLLELPGSSIDHGMVVKDWIMGVKDPSPR